MKEELNSGPLIIFIVSLSCPFLIVFLVPKVLNPRSPKFLVAVANWFVALVSGAILIGCAAVLLTTSANLLGNLLDGTFLNGGLFCFTLLLTSCLFPAVAGMLIVHKWFPEQWKRYALAMSQGQKESF